MATSKRKRVLGVLWRQYGCRARTLAETILALIHTLPPSACRCQGHRCLFCCGDEESKSSFILRSGDSSDYHTLLIGCFVVVSEDAPPVTVYDPECRWSQLEIVRRSIELMLCEQPSNLICCGYDRERRSSAAVDALTSAEWTILSRRIGDALMVYLLKYTSIFLPLSRKKHHQISSYPNGDLCSNQLAHKGYEIKRKRVEGDEVIIPVGSEEIPHKQSEENSKQKKRTRPYRWQR